MGNANLIFQMEIWFISMRDVIRNFLEPLCEKFSKKQQEKFLLNGYMKESEINYKQNDA